MDRQSSPGATSGATPGATPGRAPAASSAGYSGTPLHRKLGVRPGHRVVAVGAPESLPSAVLDADGAADLERAAAVPSGPPAQVVLVFCPDAATLAGHLPAAMALTADHGRCWVAWPKKASKVPTDLTEDVVRGAALAVGWVDVKVCAVDGVWSGLCLMRRVASSK